MYKPVYCTVCGRKTTPANMVSMIREWFFIGEEPVTRYDVCVTCASHLITRNAVHDKLAGYFRDRPLELMYLRGLHSVKEC